MTSAGRVGPLELLVIQPTPFCNLDCSYCYLPDRSNKGKMTLETLEKTFNWVFSSGLVRQPFTLLWHAGEPMVLPASFYEQATLALERCNVSGFEVTQSFQTNATLVTTRGVNLSGVAASRSGSASMDPISLTIATG
jgi:uncharacterized protein